MQCRSIYHLSFIIMKKSFLFAFFIFYLFFLHGVESLCASSGKKVVLAEVNGEAIDEGLLQERIKAIHRYKPGARPEGGAGGVDISDLLQELIDERLMIQEARGVGLDRDPGFEKRVKSFLATQSILELRREEVLDKVNVSEEEILDYFKRHHEKQSQAQEEISQRLRRRIEKKLRKEKQKELSDGFIARLREDADIRIDEELVELLDSEKDYTGTKPTIAHVNGEPIPIGDFVHDMKQAVQRQAGMFRRSKDNGQTEKKRKDLKSKVLDRLITYKLIEQEALSRNYMNAPGFADTVEKRKEALLVNEFKAKLVYPLAIPTEKELTQYYNQHIDEFKKGYEVWLREMRFGDRKEGEKILEELRQGADFEFLATLVSEGSSAKRGMAWVRAESFSPAVRDALSQLKVGEFSDLIADGRQHKIIKLKGKRGGEPIEFSRVLERLKRIVGREKFEKKLSEYLSRLRKASKIKIHKKALKGIEEKYWHQ
ncbi:MAG: peptidyl-prolyl cis-trans isomerase [Deltaproteobacteria bacterium]|nr:peptidyl-prolyl cis-trans isomerase [Deltaproteobacteria bacterium]